MLNRLLSAWHTVGVPPKGDFRIDEKIDVEVVGKDLRLPGILETVKKSYIVSDDIETGVLNKIPLSMFGLMYWIDK